MLPRVILHNGISVDGRYDWYTGDVGLYYELAGRLDTEAMMSGSNTVLTAFASAEAPEQVEEPAGPQQNNPADTRPWLIIVDSQGRVKNLGQIRRQPYWRDVIILCSLATPPAHLAYLREQQVEFIVTGEKRVNLRPALAELNARYGLKRLRIDSGGILNGALLRQGLVDEVSVVLNPFLVGGTSPRSFFTAPDLTSTGEVIPLRLVHLEQLRADAVWLRYEVVK